MLLLVLVTAITLAALAGKATARSSSYDSVNRHAAVLMWLVKHPKPGTPARRAYVWRTHMRKLVWRMGYAYRGLLCIHPHEGSWTNPNYGGLGLMHPTQYQFGPEFRAYWGTADHWPPWAQIVAGYRCWHMHGWSPWTTRGMCGL